MTHETACKHVFVLGLDTFNRHLLEGLPDARRYRFHPLLEPQMVVGADAFDVDALLAEAQLRLRASDVRPDALVGYWDFPTTLMLPLLRQGRNLPGPSLESVLRCEHKYWSRLCQREVIPEATPRFALVDPFGESVEHSFELTYPFWLKPVKAHSSVLGFAVRGPSELKDALAKLREGIGRFGEPFDRIVARADVPDFVRAASGTHCIAEEIIATNWQCTLEGWVQAGRIETYGVVDSLREGSENSSFSRYQYPSALPHRARERMVELTERLVRHVGLEDTAFNVEFFYDEIEDRVHFLEINVRISKSHGPLFERVDGTSNFHVMVATGLGERPAMPHAKGSDAIAAKFMVRVYRDGIVTRVPSEQDVAAVRERVPGVDVLVLVRDGMRLSELANQDSYTFEVANLFIGGDDERDLLEKHHRCLELLHFEIQDEAVTAHGSNYERPAPM